MSSPLLALPPELMAQILHHIGQDIPVEPNSRVPRRLGPLLALSWTSRQLRSAVEPFIYRVYCPALDDSPQRFLRALCEQPRLAKHLQIVHLKASDEQKIPPSSNDIQLFQDTMQNFHGWELHDVLLYALNKGCQAAQMVLILLLATNLQQLHLDPTDRSKCCCPQVSECIVSFLAWAATTKCRPFHNLQEVVINPRDWRGSEVKDLQYELVVSLMRHPSIRRLSISGSGFWSPPQTAHLGSSHVSDLTLRGNKSKESISPCALIDACNALKLLEISGCNDVPLLDASLQRHSSSLEQLILSKIRRPTFELGNLHSFERLHRLEINDLLFAGTGNLGVDGSRRSLTLPSTLKTLTIHTIYGLDRLLAMMARGIQHLPPTLEFLTFNCKMCIANGDYLDLIQELHTQNTKKTRFKDGTDWIIFMRDPGLGIVFQCRKGKKSIGQTVSEVVDIVKTLGAKHLLREYYADWPPYDPRMKHAFQTTRSIARHMMRSRARG